MSELKVSTDGFYCVNNAVVYDLEESLIASGYPMRTTTTQRTSSEKDIIRGAKLSSAANGINHAHDQFLTGIRVSFDLHFSNKGWVEAERYRFLEFVSSQSTMHRITKFNFRDQVNRYVDPAIVSVMENKIHEYHILDSERQTAAAANNSERASAITKQMEEKYLEILYSNPAGFELTARLTTNYRCLKNIYNQRKNHRLPEWREFCRWIETLPLAHELILCDLSLA